MRTLILITSAMIAASPALASEFRSTEPEPLEARSFQLPEAQTGQLSNGVQVTVVENNEVPMVNVRITFDRGSWNDTVEMAGLASVTLDMLNEGAGEYDAAGLSTASKRLAANISSGAGNDASQLSLGVLTKNLSPGLDLMTTVLMQPTFEQDDWDLMKKDRIAGLASARNNPRSIASRVNSRLVYGEHYKGILKTEETYGAITTEAMRTWWSTHLVPGNAQIFVGGDTNIETILPLLEERFGSWTGESTEAERPRTTQPNVEQTTIFLVDKPGAPQSVLNVFRCLDLKKTDDNWFNATMGNMMYGGMFSARLNMNLREDKGWTYGARSGLYADYAPGVWKASTSVKTDTTADSISEIMREVSESKGERPFVQDELSATSGYMLGSRPVRFEQPDYLLDQIQSIWLYDLPEDWVTGYADRVRNVSTEAAQAVWSAQIIADELSVLVVGDAATIRTGLEKLGYPIIELDTDGNPMETTK
jgi:zinc protease